MSLIPRRKAKNGRRDITTSPWGRSPWEMERFFDRFLSDPWWGSEFLSAQSWAPPLDVTETEKEVVVRTEVPGVKPDDLDVSVSGDLLTISGEKQESREHEAENAYHSERYFGSFRRSFRLPSSVDQDKVSASYENGVLTISLTKKEGAGAKRIPVSLSGK